ncbi:unnamed protein product [Lepeophtheirus salmonis]|nr:unnamed protein product [Lepeophtheirus salmonis]CAF2967327.1 unnamed protein product [Lepeophtheirus salmonis]
MSFSLNPNQLVVARPITSLSTSTNFSHSTTSQLLQRNRSTSPLCHHFTEAAIRASFGLKKRQRGRKRPIPPEEKDQRYYERRARNNLAAKKSRDQRKMRESRIALRASFLVKENVILRAQIAAFGLERQSLQKLILERQKALIQ